MTETVSVLDLAPETQLNHVMWRLALAAGYARSGDGIVSVNPDYLLTEVEAIIMAWRRDND